MEWEGRGGTSSFLPVCGQNVILVITFEQLQILKQGLHF